MADQLLHTFSAGGVIRNSTGEIIVVSQRGHSWSLPKGKLEPGEDELTAAQREIYEETGVSQLTYVRKLGTYSRPKLDAPDETKTITLFLFDTEQIELAPIDPHNPEALWVPKAEVSAMLTHPLDKSFFDSIINEI